MEDKGKRVIHYEKVKVGKRIYFFDVKENKNGDIYLVITESKENKDSTFRRDRIMIFEEYIDNFVEAFNKILDFVNTTRARQGVQAV